MNIFNSAIDHRYIRRLMKEYAVSENGIHIMSDKLRSISLELKDITIARALVLKQESLLCGADCALPEDAVRGTMKRMDVILSGNLRALGNLVKRLDNQAFLKEERKMIQNILYSFSDRELFNIRGKSFRSCNTHLMGILNATPDSFSDGGRYFDDKKALDHARDMIRDGVDIIDIGGESSRPGSQKITVEEEKRRVVDKIKLIRQESDIPISIDTYKAEVAEAAFSAGADILNYIYGYRIDSEMLDVIIKHRPPVFLMHMRQDPETMQTDTEYKDIIPDILDEICDTESKLVDILGRDKVIIDPGIGFGKTMESNWEIIRRIDTLRQRGASLLMGVSRKSFISGSISHDLKDRDDVTLMLSMLFMFKGVEFIRVHNTHQHLLMKKVCEMTGVL